MSFQHLPAEILLQTYKYIDKEEVGTCIAVCKSWSVPAIQTYYEELTLSKHKVKSLRLMLFLDDDNDKKNYGRKNLVDNFYWVKKLIIDERLEYNFGDNDSDRISTKFETQEFLTLLSYFTNLKILDFGLSKFYNDYMLALRDLDKQSLTSIEEICKRSNYGYDESHFLACYKFRHSLTHLTLSSFTCNYTIDGLSGDCSSFLPMFKKLTHLTVSIEMENLELFHFLELCPNLINIKYTNHFYDHKESDAARQFNYGKQLKSLKLCLPLLKDPYLSYIENYPPNYLETLHIDMNNVDFYGWLTDYSIEALKNLGKCMSLIKNLEISTQLNGRNTGVRVIYDKRDIPAETKMTRFYLFLGAIRGNRDLYCHAVCKQSEIPETLIKVEEDSKLLSFTYWLGFNNYAVFDGPMGGLPEFNSLLPLPDSKITPTGPDIINSLSFILCHMQLTIPQQILKYALNNCTQIDNLEVTVISGPEICKFMAGGTGEKTLAINNRLAQLKSTQQNLTSIKLEGIELDEDLAGLIAPYLQEIDSISCIIGKAGRTGRRRSDTVHHGCIFDFTMFKNLKKIYARTNADDDISSIIYVYFGFVDSEKKNNIFSHNNLKKIECTTMDSVDNYIADKDYSHITIINVDQHLMDNLIVCAQYDNTVTAYHLCDELDSLAK